MVNSKAPSTRRGLSLVLALLLLLSVFGVQAVQTETSHAAMYESYNGIYATQMGSGKCTLASCVMMMRSKAKMMGSSSWQSITQSAIISTAWSGGLLHSFSYAGMKISYGNFSAGNHKAQLIAILQKHPEGFEIYERGLPHAIFLTRYDSSTDTFYCADPALGAKEMTLAESWLRKCTSSTGAKAVQNAIIEALDSYWYISSYDGVAAAAYDAAYLEKVKQEQANGQTSDSAGLVDDNQDNYNFGTTVNDNSMAGLVDDSAVSSEVIITDNAATPICISFERVNSYVQDQFTDVRTKDWFAKYVATAYEMGLMQGVDKRVFDVSGNVTLAQAVTLAARVNNINETGGNTSVFKSRSGEAWYMAYARYSIERGVIDEEVYKAVQASPNREITRLEFSYIVGNALPAEALVTINNVDYGDIPDVDYNTPAGKIVYSFYRSGILAGYKDGRFNPDANITRAEVSAVMSRMGDSSQRMYL